MNRYQAALREQSSLSVHGGVRWEGFAGSQGHLEFLPVPAQMGKALPW